MIVCMCVVCVCVCVCGGVIKKMEKGERKREEARQSGEKCRMQWGPKADHTCELQAQTRPCTEPEGSSAPAVPSPSLPTLPSFLLTHLCSAGRHIMSPRNPLKRMSLSEQATITQTCQALPVGIKSNTSDWRHLPLTIENLPQSRIRLD